MVGLRVAPPYFALGEGREKDELALGRVVLAPRSVQKSSPLGVLEEPLRLFSVLG